MHLPLSTLLAALLASSTAAAMPAGSESGPALAPRQMSNFRCQPPSLNPYPTVLRTMMFRDDFCADDCQHRDQLDDTGGTAVELGNWWRASGRRSIKFEILDERL
jgi:hypothetical protein